MSTWYYYDSNDQKQGPVTGGQLKGLAKTGRITPETKVETEGGKIAPARKVKGLTFIASAQPESAQPIDESGLESPAQNPFVDSVIVEPSPFAVAPSMSDNPFAGEPSVSANPFAAVAAPPVNQPLSQSIPAVEGGGGSSWQVTLVGIVLLLIVGGIAYKILDTSGEKTAEDFTVAESKFLKRCPEVSIDKIPKDSRTIFIASYELGRPRLEGKDVVLLIPPDEDISDIENTYTVERLGNTSVAGLTMLEIRVKDAGAIEHTKAVKEYYDAFIPTFLGVLPKPVAPSVTKSSIVQQADEVDRPAQTGRQQTTNRAHDFVKDFVATVPLPEVYRNNTFGFSFRYPKDWNKPSGTSSNISIAGTADSDGTPNMNIKTIQRDNSLFEPNAFVGMQDNLQKSYEASGVRNVRFKDFGLRKFATKDCIYCNLQCATKEGLDLEILQFMFHHRSVTLTVTLAAGQRNFEKNRPILDSIISSFQFMD